MPNLTRRETRRLEFTGNLVRMYLACITVLFPVLCVLSANHKYASDFRAEGPPEIPPSATYGTIVGIYLPLFAAVAAYIWATRAFPARSKAPHGYAMALFRDVFTIFVATTVLIIPVLLYFLPGRLQDRAPLLVWYQTVITAALGAAFTYYFHATLSPGKSPGGGDEPERSTRTRAAERAPAS